MTDEPKTPPPDSSDTQASESDDTSRAAESAPARDDKAPGSAEAAADAGTIPPPPDADLPRPSPESQAAQTGKAPSGTSDSGTTVPAAGVETEMAKGETEAATKAAPPARPKPASAPPANETPEEKKARLERIIAEAKAKKEAAAAAAAQAEGGEPKAAASTKAATTESAEAATTKVAEAAKKAGAETAPGEGGEASAAGSSGRPPGGKSPEVGDPLKSPSQADLERAAKIAEAKARAAALKEAAAGKTPAASPGATPGAAKTPAAAGAAGAAGVPKPPVKKKEEGPKPADASDHALVKRLREKLGEAVTGAFTFLGQLSIHVRPDSVVEACRALRDDAETPFNYLSDLTCVHWPERDDAPFELVYNLYSISKNERVRVKSAAGAEGIESVTSVWPTANWMEREVYDLFGVRFRNHPDLRRLLLPSDWDGHPLRKDYPLEFMENEWTTRHLPIFDEVQREQLAQRRAYGLEILQTPDERRLRELFRDARDPLPKEHK